MSETEGGNKPWKFQQMKVRVATKKWKLCESGKMQKFQQVKVATLWSFRESEKLRGTT